MLYQRGEPDNPRVDRAWRVVTLNGFLSQCLFFWQSKGELYETWCVAEMKLEGQRAWAGVVFPGYHHATGRSANQAITKTSIRRDALLLTRALKATDRAHGTYITRVLLSPDVRHLATCSADHTARIWAVDLEGPPPNTQDPDHEPVYHCHGGMLEIAVELGRKGGGLVRRLTRLLRENPGYGASCWASVA